MIETLALGLAKRGFSMVGDAVLKRGQKEVENLLGVELTADMSPEQEIELQEAVRLHARELMKMAHEDRADARASMNKSNINRYFVHGMTTFWSLIAASLIFGLVFFDIPEANVRFADTIIGFVLGTIIATMMGFYYGSSSKEVERDD